MQRNVRYHMVLLATDSDTDIKRQVFINLVNLSPSSQLTSTRVGFTATVVEVCGSTRTRGYGSGMGRCLTGRVGYGYELVHGSGIPVFTRKEHHFSRCWRSNVLYFFLL